MTTAEQAELVVNLRLRDQFTAPVKKLQANLATLDRQTAQLQRGLGKIGQGLKTGIGNAAKIAAVGVGFLALQLRAGIQELIEWEDAQLQVNAAIKSTKGVAGVSASAVEDLADKYADLSLAEDDVILGAQAILLRYPRVTKDVFEPALRASLDLSQAMGTDLTSAAKMVARALDDPISGLTKLTRAGITFTDREKEKIKRLQETGRTLEAQNIILRKLERRFGGSALNATKGFRGQVKLLSDRVKDLQQAFAGPLLPAITAMVTELTKFAERPEIVQQVKDFGAALAGFVTAENIEEGFYAIKSGFGFIRDLPWSAIKSGLQTTADVAKKAVDLFRSLPPEVQTGLVTLLAANKLTGGLVASGIGDVAGFLLRNLTTINAGVVTVIGKSVTGGGAATATTAAATSAAAVLGAFAVAAGFNIALRDPARQDDLGATYGGELGTGSLGQTNYDVLQNRIGMERERLRRLVEASGGGAMGRAGFSTVGALRELSELNPLVAQLVEQQQRAEQKFEQTYDEVINLQGVNVEKVVGIRDAVLTGNKTYQEGNRKLDILRNRAEKQLREQAAQTAAIEGQKVSIALQARVNISAAATGNSITFGNGTSRILIPT